MELDKKQLRKQLIQMRLAFDENQKQSHFIIEKLKKDVHFIIKIIDPWSLTEHFLVYQKIG